MKSSLLLLAFPLLLAAACNDEKKETENKDLLSTDLVTNPASANGTDSAVLKNLPIMDFRDSVFDFGTINEGEVVSHSFEFTNNGKTPLIISSANGSCGCTVADFPHDPLPPGKSSTMNVQFSSAGKHGHQEKTVTINTNSVRGVHFLYVKGEVKTK